MRPPVSPAGGPFEEPVTNKEALYARRDDIVAEIEQALEDPDAEAGTREDEDEDDEDT